MPAPGARAPGTASLTDLIAPVSLERVQDAFAQAHGCATIFLDATGQPVTTPTGSSGPCELLSGRSANARVCQRGLEALLRQAAAQFQPFLFACSCDLPSFVVPVHARLAHQDAEPTFLGCLLVGHVRFGTLALPGRQSAERVRAWDEFARVDRAVLEGALELVHESIQGIVTATERAAVDDLTGLFTWRLFAPMARQAVGEALRYRDPLSCLMIDVDQLKDLNQRFDHVGADAVLRQLAGVIRGGLRRADTIGRRYAAGDEFVVLLPQTDLRRAVQTARKIRHAVNSEKFAVGKKKTTASVSIGVATLDLDAEDADAAVTDLLETADRAVIQAKRLGRDCVCAPLDGVVERRAYASRVQGSVAKADEGPLAHITIAVLTDGVVLGHTESDEQGVYSLQVKLANRKCEVRCVLNSTATANTQPEWLDPRTAVADFRF